MEESKVNSYLNFIKDVLEKSEKKGQLLVLKDVDIDSEFFSFVDDNIVDKNIHLNIERKLKYIKKNYYSGKITKKNPCIEEVNSNEILFRCSRIFPTLYLDLKVIKGLSLKRKLKFKKLFIGYHILGLERIFKAHKIEIKNEDYHRTLNHWKKRFSNEDFKLSMLKKYKAFLNSENI